MEVNLEAMFNQCQPRDGTEDPEKWFQRLNHLRRQLEQIGKTKDNASVIAVILMHLPEEYSAIKTLERKEARKKILDLEDLMDDIKAVYRTDISGIKSYEFGQIEEEASDENNKAMTATTNKKGKGRDMREPVDIATKWAAGQMIVSTIQSPQTTGVTRW